MPNWCENKVTIYGPLVRLQELKKAAQENRLLQHIKPMPDELEDTVAPTPKDSNPKDVEVLQEKYGASNWYDWSINNWATKWDVDDVIIDEEESDLRPASFSLETPKNRLTLAFYTAW